MNDKIYKYLRFLFYTFIRGPYQRLKYYQSEHVIKRNAGNMDVFHDIYSKKLWRSRESVSGTGSTLSNTMQIRNVIPELLKKYGARTVLDLPCGDFNWMRRVDLSDIQYTGADLIKDLITQNKKYENENVRFITLNLIKDDLPQSDLILVRDCLVHFSFGDIQRAIINIKKSNSGYLLTTSFINHNDNRDIETGFWRPINLMNSPFDFPEPLEILDDFGNGIYMDKRLLLWRIKDLPNDWG